MARLAVIVTRTRRTAVKIMRLRYIKQYGQNEAEPNSAQGSGETGKACKVFRCASSIKC